MYNINLLQITETLSNLFRNSFNLKWLKGTGSLTKTSHIDAHILINIEFQMLKDNNHM